MKYMGSKNRHAKEILPIILKDRRPDQWYVEPFVGGCNMIDKVSGARIGNDYHPLLISMWQAVQEGWLPPDFVSEQEYKAARTSLSIAPWLKAFIGFGCSFSGKWFGGYARGKNDKGQDRNYCLESKTNLMRQVDNLKDVKFRTGSYVDLIIPDNSIIYCDPPYQGTTKYKASEEQFDYEFFWGWVRDRTQEGHHVFVSEYNAPEDFKCIWEKQVNNSLTKDTGSKKGTEKLFVLNEL